MLLVKAYVTRIEEDLFSFVMDKFGNKYSTELGAFNPSFIFLTIIVESNTL